MPANFDRQQRINRATGFVEWPTGPLNRVDGERILRIEVWVMQKTRGAVQMTYWDSQNNRPPPPPNHWIADDVTYPQPWNGGRFIPGPALGTALLVALRGPAPHYQTYYWWSEEVEL